MRERQRQRKEDRDRDTQMDSQTNIQKQNTSEIVHSSEDFCNFNVL